VLAELTLVLTFYCGGRCCVGTHVEHGLTRSGVRPTPGWTVAADPRRFPLGTVLWVEGLGERMVQDTGSRIRGRRVDVFVRDHKEALSLGRRRARARVVRFVPPEQWRQDRVTLTSLAVHERADPRLFGLPRMPGWLPFLPQRP
jgi:3D (Asp-Asp-Asp) domain-containing protein